MLENRQVIGLSEKVFIFDSRGNEVLCNARIDTGATRCSIDRKLFETLDIDTQKGTKIIKSALGKHEREFAKITFRLGKKKATAVFTIANRKNVKFPVLIGSKALKLLNVVVDPKK